MLTYGRAGAARFFLPLTFVAAMAAGAAVAQDSVDEVIDEPGVTEPGVSEPGDPDAGGEWVDEPIDLTDGGPDPVEGLEYLYDGGEDVPVVADCDGCEAWTLGGERPVMENARNEVAALPNPRGRDGGTCSEDGFIPLPWRCSW
jgi:hypothetical protein